jgi:hypothetical protein
MNDDGEIKHPGFDPIQKEILRQYEQGIRTSESLDSKIGIMLGFIFVIIGIISSISNPISLNQSIPPQGIILIAGMALLLIAAFLGFWAYYMRRFQGGADPDELIEMYRMQPDRDFEMIIARKIDESRIHNRDLNREKAKLTKIMFIIFFLALLMIVISRFQ